ncbi:hypothetical protein LPJ61_003880 [Coemansia biformis]|uniref:DUF21-domain-containing protein n=1 Tax=Coemansia biformis TaxID=1286918 RepID=A0A9W7YBQ6_9FUNG|nr:hypothetical protein LPJ61_003880 [Coemansia biformis]
MSLEETNLRILATSGTATQREYARRILPIRRNGHWLLVTLLLGNTIVNETLPIVMDSVLGGSGVTAVVISTAAIVLFGEIIPQSLCARYGLAIGAFFAHPVRVLLCVLAPLAYPVALLLDYVLGPNHSAIYKRAQLKELVSLSDAAHGGNLTADEITIIRGALELGDKLVADVMTELDSVYMVNTNARLDRSLLAEMVRHGHSRVPVYDGRREDIVGVLLVKSLVLLDPDACTPVRDARIAPVPLVTTFTPLYDILNAFQEGGSHMAVVMGPPPRRHPPLFAATPAASIASGDTPAAGGAKRMAGADAPLLSAAPRQRYASAQSRREAPAGMGARVSSYIAGESAVPMLGAPDHVLSTYVPIGIITLEDVIEELIQEEIVDETDVFVDMRKRVRVVRATAGSVPPLVVPVVMPPGLPQLRCTSAPHARHPPALPQSRAGRHFAFSSCSHKSSAQAAAAGEPAGRQRSVESSAGGSGDLQGSTARHSESPTSDDQDARSV